MILDEYLKIQILIITMWKTKKMSWEQLSIVNPKLSRAQLCEIFMYPDTLFGNE